MFKTFQKNYFLDHVVIRGFGNNPIKSYFPKQALDKVNNRFPNEINKNISINEASNSRNFNSNQANSNSFDYRNFEQMPNEYSFNMYYPTFDKIDYDAQANYSNEGLIKK